MNNEKLTQRQIGGIFGSLIGGLVTGGHVSVEDLRAVLRQLADDERLWRAFTTMLPSVVHSVIEGAIQEELGRREEKKS